MAVAVLALKPSQTKRPIFQFRNCFVEEKFLSTSDGAKIKYWDIKPSDGRPFDPRFAVLTLPGWLCKSSIFAPTIASLSKQYRVIAIEARGHGGSTIGKSNDKTHMKNVAEDAVAIVGRESLDAIAVVGHSKGGLIAYDLALSHPDLVKSLILVCSPYTNPVVTSVVRDIPGIGAFIKALSRAVELIPLAEPVKDFGLARIQLFEELGRRALNGRIMDTRFLTHEAFSKLFHGALEVDINYMFVPLRAMLDVKRSLGDLRGISQPTLMLTGDKDWLVEARLIECAAENIPKSHFVVIQGKGHVLTIEAPMDSARIIRSFIGETTGV